MIVDGMHVVVPAHQEEQLLGRQLRAIGRAVHEVTAAWPRVRTSVTVVLDACDDGSAEVAASFARVTAFPMQLRCVGAARAAGIERARRLAHVVRPESTWIACTDADSQVPDDWLVSQIHLALQGADLVLGTVRPDEGHISARARRRWLRRHVLEDGHTHVHGANLGFRLSAYDSVGGFRPLQSGEDVDLAERLRTAGARVVRTARHPVLTSSRLHGRATDGFASYLVDL